MEHGTMLVDRYRIEEKTGEGSMGAVYKARDTTSGNKLCAIKERQVPKVFGDESTRMATSEATKLDDESWPQSFMEQLQKQFKQEAKILMKLSHPRLPQVTNYFGTDDGCQYMVMDLIEGKNLQEIQAARGAPLSEEEVMIWISQVMDAIGYVHQSHIAHGDIKPENIRVTPEGQAFLVDFGIAGFIGQSPLIGLTRHYAAPEVREKHQATPSGDIYSLGATLFCLLTGQPPAEQQAKETTHQALEKKGSTVSPRMRQAIECMLDADPDKRFKSVREAQEHLCLFWWSKLVSKIAKGIKKRLDVNFRQGEFATYFPDDDPPCFIAADPEHLLVLASQRGAIRTYLTSVDQPYGVEQLSAIKDELFLQDLVWAGEVQGRSHYRVLGREDKNKSQQLWTIIGSGGGQRERVLLPGQAELLAHDGDHLFVMIKQKRPGQPPSLDDPVWVMPPPDCETPTDFVATRDAWIVAGAEKPPESLSHDQPAYRVWIMRRPSGSSWQPVDFQAYGHIYLAKCVDDARVYAYALGNARHIVAIIDILSNASNAVQTRLEPGDWPEVKSIAANRDRLFVLGADGHVHWFGHQSLVKYSPRKRHLS